MSRSPPSDSRREGSHSIPPEIEDRIEGIAERFLDELHAGRSPDRSDWVAAHPDIAAILDEHLALREQMFRAAQAAQPPDTGRAAPRPAAQELLFAALAFQNEYIDLAQFAAACRDWATDKTRPLADRLVERGWIDGHVRKVLEEIAERKLKRYDGNVHATLGAVAEPAVRDAIKGIDDSDIRDSLSSLPPAAGHVLMSVEAASEAGSEQHAADQDLVRLTTIDAPQGSRSRYTLVRLHGEGGLGRVWLARDGQLGREVALKELQPQKTVRTDAWRRFLKEAQITGQLEHPNIVPVYELGQHADDDHPFYTMRFVRGRTLHEAIATYHDRRRAGLTDPLEFRRLLDALISVCHAIGYAHSRGVVHRDLKPSNVVLGDFGEVIVLDWGLAKVVGKGDPTAISVAIPESIQSNPTVAGGVLGTPAYMSPEQAQGRINEIDARTDIYGLGAVLFEILIGRPPHTGKDTHEILQSILAHDTPRASTIARSLRERGDSAQGDGLRSEPTTLRVPPVLDAICFKAMSKSRATRYARASDLANDARRWLADEPVAICRESVATRLARWGRRHKPVVTGAAALLVTAVIALGITILLVAKEQARTEKARQAEAAEGKLRLAEERRARHAEQEALRNNLNEYAARADSYLETARVLHQAGDRADAVSEALKLIERSTMLRPAAEKIIQQMNSPDDDWVQQYRNRWDERIVALRDEAARWLTDMRPQRLWTVPLPPPPIGSELPIVAISPDGQRFAAFYYSTNQILILNAKGSVVQELMLPADVATAIRTTTETSSATRDFGRTDTTTTAFAVDLVFAKDELIAFKVGKQLLTWTNRDGEFRPETNPSADSIETAPRVRTNPRYLVEEIDQGRKGKKFTVRDVARDESPRTIWQDSEEEVIQRWSRPLFGTDPRSLFLLSNKSLVLVDLVTVAKASGPLAEPGMKLVDAKMQAANTEVLTIERVVDSGNPTQSIDRLAFWSGDLSRLRVTQLYHDVGVRCIDLAEDGVLLTGADDRMLRTWRNDHILWSSGVPKPPAGRNDWLGPWDVNTKNQQLEPHKISKTEERVELVRSSIFPNPGRFRSLQWRRTIPSRSTEHTLAVRAPEPYPGWGFHSETGFLAQRHRPTATRWHYSELVTEVYSAEDGSLIRSFPTTGVGRVVSASGDHRFAVVVAEENESEATLELWSLDQLRPVTRLGSCVSRANAESGSRELVLAVTFLARTRTREPEWLLIAQSQGDSADGASVQVWKLPQGRHIGSFSAPAMHFDAELDDSGCRAVFMRTQRREGAPYFAQVFDLQTATKLADLEGFEVVGRRGYHAFGADCFILVWRNEPIDSPHRVTLWDLATGKGHELHGTVWTNIESNNSGIPHLTLRSDGDRLLIYGIGHLDGQAHVEMWDVRQRIRLADKTYPTLFGPELIVNADDYAWFFSGGSGSKLLRETICWNWPDAAEVPTARFDAVPVAAADPWVLWRGAQKWFIQKGSGGQRTALEDSSRPFTQFYLPEGAANRVLALGPNGGLWDAESGWLIAKFPSGHAYKARDSSERWAVSASRTDGELLVWDTQSGQPVRRCKPRESNEIGFDAVAAAIKLNSRGDRLAVFSQGLIRLWDVDANRPVLTLEKASHQLPPVCVTQSIAAGLVASGDPEGTVLIWDRNKGQMIRSILAHSSGITALAFTANGDVLFSAATDGSLAAWRPDGTLLWKSIPGPSGVYVRCFLSTSSKPRILHAGLSNGQIIVVDVNTHETVNRLDVDSTAIQAIAYSFGKSLIAAGSAGGRIHIRNADDVQAIRTWDAGTTVTSLTFVPRSDLIAVGGKAVRFLDLTSGQCVLTLPVVRPPVSGLAIDSTCGDLYVSDQDITVRAYSFSDMARQFELLKLGLPGELAAQWPKSRNEGGEEFSELWRGWLRLAREFSDNGQAFNVWYPSSRATELNPDAWQPRHYLGLYEAYSGRPEKAIDEYNKAIDLKPNQWYPWFHRGLAFENLAKLPNALDDFNEAISRGANEAGVWFARGRVRRQMSETDLALDDLNRATEIDPRFGPAYLERGALLHDRQSFNNAINDLTKAIYLLPEHPSAYLIRAKCYLAENEPDRSIADCKAALEIYLEYVDAYRVRARAYQLKSDQERAERDLETARRLEEKLANSPRSRGSMQSVLNLNTLRVSEPHRP